MPWKCPACSTPIQHSEFEPEPRPQTRYRCSACRLELLIDNQSGTLVVAPIADGSAATGASEG